MTRKPVFWIAIPITLLTGLTISSNPPGGSWFVWACTGAGIAIFIGLLWALCRRMGWGIIPGFTAATVLMGLAEVALQHPFPGSVFGAVLGATSVALASRIWAKTL